LSNLLRPIGGTLFKVPASVKINNAPGQVSAGYLERSNVDPAIELTKMMGRHEVRTGFDFIRYQLSAAENVALGRGGTAADSPDVSGAARRAGLDAVVERLPQGFDTPLSRSRTDGVDLSGGQWQQVALARTLLAVRRGAGLLVLDEPTAHLDVRTEAELFARLRGREDGTSVVLISHRLATVRRADRIVVLDGGRITETGSHDDLMARDGTYAAMFRLQAERFARGYDDRLDESEA